MYCLIILNKLERLSLTGRRGCITWLRFSLARPAPLAPSRLLAAWTTPSNVGTHSSPLPSRRFPCRNSSRSQLGRRRDAGASRLLGCDPGSVADGAGAGAGAGSWRAPEWAQRSVRPPRRSQSLSGTGAGEGWAPPAALFPTPVSIPEPQFPRPPAAQRPPREERQQEQRRQAHLVDWGEGGSFAEKIESVAKTHRKVFYPGKLIHVMILRG